MTLKISRLYNFGGNACLKLLFIIAEFVQFVKHFLEVGVFDFMASPVFLMILSELALVHLPVVCLIFSPFKRIFSTSG